MAKLKADPKIVDRVRELVWDTGLSYVALAEKLDIRYPGTISGWVNSEKTISTEALRRLCAYTKTSADWVLGLSEKREM